MLKDLFKKIKGKEKTKKEPEAVSPKKEESKPAIDLKGDRLSFQIIKSPHISEKTTNLGVLNQYGFKIFNTANKTEIKKAVEKIYNVKVQKVRILNMPSKLRQVGAHEGYKPGFKKAIVTLTEGYKIEIPKHG